MTASVKAAIEALTFDNNGHKVPPAIIAVACPIEIIDRVTEVLNTLSVVVANAPDALEALAGSSTSISAVCTMLDGMEHSLVAAKRLIEEDWSLNT